MQHASSPSRSSDDFVALLVVEQLVDAAVTMSRPNPPGRRPFASRTSHVRDRVVGWLADRPRAADLSMLNPGPGSAMRYMSMRLRAQVGNPDRPRRIELAAPFDGVQQQLAKRVARSSRADRCGRSASSCAITLCRRSAASRVHGTTSSTHSGRAEITSIGGGSGAGDRVTHRFEQRGRAPPACART